jgi:hypothetical protein
MRLLPKAGAPVASYAANPCHFRAHPAGEVDVHGEEQAPQLAIPEPQVELVLVVAVVVDRNLLHLAC